MNIPKYGKFICSKLHLTQFSAKSENLFYGRELITTSYNSGKGDCFYIAVQQGLRLLRMVEFDKDEMRKDLSLWFQDDGNSAAITALHSAHPYDIIPHLHYVGGVEPRVGWRTYLRGRNWKFWGRRIAKKGTWVGAIELEAMNDLLLNAGYDVRVNIYVTTLHQRSSLVRIITLQGIWSLFFTYPLDILKFYTL